MSTVKESLAGPALHPELFEWADGVQAESFAHDGDIVSFGEGWLPDPAQDPNVKAIIVTDTNRYFVRNGMIFDLAATEQTGWPAFASVKDMPNGKLPNIPIGSSWLIPSLGSEPSRVTGVLVQRHEPIQTIAKTNAPGGNFFDRLDRRFVNAVKGQGEQARSTAQDPAGAAEARQTASKVNQDTVQRSQPGRESASTKLTVPDIDEAVLRIAADPQSAGGKAAITEAKRLTAYDAALNKRIVRDQRGDAYWASEYPNVFAFTGELRGQVDKLPDDPDQWPPAVLMMQVNDGLGGNKTSVIIETDAGEMITVRRTSPGDVLSASEQSFDMYTASMAADVNNDGSARPIDHRVLKDAVVVPGMPLRLGADPATGKTLGSRGNVTRITAIKHNPQNRVARSHSWLNRPELNSDAIQRYTAAMEQAVKQRPTTKLGAHAVKLAFIQP